MAYERDNRGRVFTHSRDEFGDFGAFGGDIVSVPANVKPWECITIPACTLFAGNPNVPDVIDLFPRYFWSTYVTGRYATGAVAAWLKFLGRNPIDYIIEAPAGLGSHTYYDNVQGDLSGAVDLQPAWTLSDELTARLNPGPNSQLAIDGSRHGLTVWPPLKFRNQLHLDAWLAHYECWRYGFDGVKCRWPFMYSGLPFGVTPPNPSWCNPGMKAYRSFPSGFENQRPYDYIYPCSAQAAIRKTYEQLIDVPLRRIIEGEKMVVPIDPFPHANPDPGSNLLWYKRYFHQMPLDDTHNERVSTLYALTCAQMSYYMGYAGHQDAFPSVDGMYCDDGVGPLAIFQYMVEFSKSLMTLNPAGAVGATANFVGQILQQRGGGAPNLPWHPMWRPVVAPAKMFTDQPPPPTIIVTTPVATPVLITTEGVRRTPTNRDRVFFSPEFLATHTGIPTQVPNKELSLSLLAALGLGGYLLWKYLRK